MQSTLSPIQRRMAPIITLLLLAPVIAEVLFGSTHITTLYLLIIQIGAYGCGALMIREVVRRQHKGWVTILLLSIAFAITEECVMLQSSLYPLFAMDIQHIYDRALGVNWLYLLCMLIYESVWAIVLPIQLTEMLFPSQHTEPWLSKRGFGIAAIVFLLASAVAWYSWTHGAVPRFYPHLVYQTPLLTIGIAIIVIVLLIIVALGPWSLDFPVRKRSQSAPWPWLVGLVAFVLSLPWFALILFHVGVFPSVPPMIPFVVAIVLVVIGLALLWYWSGSSDWQDRHRLALISGAILASMLAGYIASGITLPIDFIGKLVLNLAAVVLLIYFGHKLRQRKASQVGG